MYDRRIQGKSTLVRVTQRGFELSGVNCIHFGMLRYFHVSFAHCSLYLFRSPFNFVPSVIVYFSYLISCRITQYHQLRRIGPAYLLFLSSWVYKRSRLLIDGSVLFLRVNRRTPVCLLGFYFSRIAQSACLLSLLSPWVTNKSRWFLNFSSLYALLFFLRLSLFSE